MCDMQLSSHLFCSVSFYSSLLFYPALIKNYWTSHDTVGRLVMKLHIVVCVVRLCEGIGEKLMCWVACQWLLLSIVFGESHEHDIQCGYHVQLKKSHGYYVDVALISEGPPLSMIRTPVSPVACLKG